MFNKQCSQTYLIISLCKLNNFFLKDVINEYIGGKLNTHMYPFLGENPDLLLSTSAAVSARTGYGDWNKTKLKSIPKLIIFILGGVTYSELRIINEIKNERKNFDIILGSSHIMTPVRFLNSFKISDQKPSKPLEEMEIDSPNQNSADVIQNCFELDNCLVDVFSKFRSCF